MSKAQPATSQNGEQHDENEDGGVQTLKEQAPRFPCSIAVTASVSVSKRLEIHEDGVLSEGNYGRPDWPSAKEETYRCTNCDEKFETKAEAREHLRERFKKFKQWYRMPLALTCSEFTPFAFDDEASLVELDDISVRGRYNDLDTAVLLTSGVDALLATSRRALELPQPENLKQWDAFDDNGVLTYPDGSYRVSPQLVGRAVEYLQSDSAVRLLNSSSFESTY
jgi:hypothetical protein